MIDLFTARATEVGAQVCGPMNRQTVPLEVVQRSRSAGARTALLSSDLEEMGGPIAEALVGVGVVPTGGPSTEAAARADLGISVAAIAIAETGSVVVAGNDLVPRLATMLPLVHVVLVETRRLVASLDEALDYIREVARVDTGEAVRYLSIVTGPSRTADIEKTLSTGVHGPRELHILLIE
jgi:L-lactate dehydrogenase complex protein LldG